jgi:hypothetical protein
MVALFNDGAIPFGGVVLTINSVTYIAEDIKLTKATNKIPRTDELGTLTGQVVVMGEISGSATLQLAAAATAIPPLGATGVFTSVLSSEASATYILTSVGLEMSKDGYHKVPIEFTKKLNS